MHSYVRFTCSYAQYSFNSCLSSLFKEAINLLFKPGAVLVRAQWRGSRGGGKAGQPSLKPCPKTLEIGSSFSGPEWLFETLLCLCLSSGPALNLMLLTLKVMEHSHRNQLLQSTYLQATLGDHLPHTKLRRLPVVNGAPLYSRKNIPFTTMSDLLLPTFNLNDSPYKALLLLKSRR